MALILHPSIQKSPLSFWYQRAFTEAIELYIVTAYLTAWDEGLELNKGCKSFRLIVGKDFGITRKAACEAVMRWLPAHRKSQFLVADSIDGFHPKALFWASESGYFSIIGSSNLTKAAFETNYEANFHSTLTKNEFVTAKGWVRDIEARSVVLSADWLSGYIEAKRTKPKSGKPKESGGGPLVIALRLPNPKGRERLVSERRNQLKQYRRHRGDLFKLFQSCADGIVTNSEFYKKLPTCWSYGIGNRLQGRGWERQGKSANFRELSNSLFRIVDANKDDRDDIVTTEIDYLRKRKNSARTAFLSEILCLEFPDKYPVLNDPVNTYLKNIHFKSPRGASEGAKYIDLSKKLRLSLRMNPNHVAKNVAELDAVIWLAYGKKKA